MITLFASSESPIDSFKNTAYRRGLYTNQSGEDCAGYRTHTISRLLIYTKGIYGDTRCPDREPIPRLAGN